MNKRIMVGVLAVGVLFFQSICSAEPICLKNGKKIRGQIVEKTDKQVKVDISGVKITYYNDEIDRIEAADAQASANTEKKSQPAVLPSGGMNEKSAASAAIEKPAPVLPSSTVPSTEPTPEPAVVSTNSANVMDAKKSLILELIDVSGTKETMSQMFDQIISQAPVEQASSLKSVLNITEVISRLVPIYDKYFNEAELKELIAFYKGETGRKLIKVMPLLMEDSMNASMAYFQEKMPTPNHDGSGSAQETSKEKPVE